MVILNMCEEEIIVKLEYTGCMDEGADDFESTSAGDRAHTENYSKHGTDLTLNQPDRKSCLSNDDRVPMFMFTEGIKSWTTYNWLCTKCENVFNDINELRVHSEVVHGCCADFKCADCGDLFRAFEAFVEHVRGHWECLRNLCEICNVCHDNQPVDHKAVHSNQFPCQQCGKLYLTRKNRDDHSDRYNLNVKEVKKFEHKSPTPVESEASDDEDSDEDEEAEDEVGDDDSWADYPWTCAVCEKRVNSITKLRQHSEVAHKTCFSMKCVDCDEVLVYPTYKNFTRHVKRHRNYLRNYCEYCDCKYEKITKGEHQITHDKHYICKRCGNFYSTLEEYNEHAAKLNMEPKKVKKKEFSVHVRVIRNKDVKGLKDKSWTGYPWCCRLCDKKFSGIEVLRKHSKDVHKTCFSMKCADCEMLLDSFQDFVYHVKRHRRFLRQHCIFCNVRYSATLKDSDHIKTHFPDTKMLCEGCGEILPNVDELVTHVNRYNSPKASHKPHVKYKHNMEITCQVCGKVLTSVNAYRRHLEIHEGRLMDHVCDLCGKSYQSKASLDYHFEVNHTNSAMVSCEICNKLFKTPFRLRMHKKTHSKLKPYQCEVCLQCFRDRVKLRRHFKVHTNDKPFECQFCGKSFKQNVYLKKHLHQHTGERPYTCVDCGMGFTNWGNCNKHMIRRHGKTLSKKSADDKTDLRFNVMSGVMGNGLKIDKGSVSTGLGGWG